VKICNLENRRILVTLPTLKYWLEGLFRLLGIDNALAKLCCEEPEIQIDAVSRPDLLNSIFNQAVQEGGTINAKAVFQHLGVMLKDLTAFMRQ
jgi:hypothetical protein